MTHYYLGIDAGGTKTHCLIADALGHIKGFGKAGTGSYEYYGVDPAFTENKLAIERALQDAGLNLSDIAGIGMGIAGADLPEDYAMLEERIYTPLLGSIPRAFRNDSFAGLRGGTRAPYGIVIACGTGCVCAGKNPDGAETRVGGFGGEFGDECSGSDLGRLGLQRIWQARDTTRPNTLLTNLYVERSGCKDRDELFLKLYRQEITHKQLEPMAQLVFDAAVMGDEAACDILERGGNYLGLMVNAVARRLGMTHSDFEVVMAGSVFKGSSPVLMDAMLLAIHRVCPKARVIKPVFEPVVGALLLGMELDITITDAIYDTLSQELKAAEIRYGEQFKSE